MELYVKIRRNEYHDSLELLLATSILEEMPGIGRANVGMGTENSVKLFRTLGLYTEEMAAAGARIDAIDALKLAEEAGVVLDFETEAVAPLLCGSAVEGLIVRQNGALLELHSDLLIDSAGLYSPVRTKLPASFGIPNTINPRSVFHVWRAYYENTTGERIVADGYAAIGDSAGMTVPLNGSGIILSMNAGKILADTVNAIDGACTKKALWPYEYEYFMRHGKDLVMIDIIKTLFTYVKGADIDYLMEKKILVIGGSVSGTEAANLLIKT